MLSMPFEVNIFNEHNKETEWKGNFTLTKKKEEKDETKWGEAYESKRTIWIRLNRKRFLRNIL